MDLRATARRLNIFATVEALLTLAALTLVATTVGSHLGPLLGLTGTPGHIAGWTIALVYDALWIGALRMSEAAIRQRSRLGMAVMLGLSGAAVAVSTGTLLILGHARVFAFVPLAAALFMGLRIFAAHVLADDDTANTIAAQDAADRRNRALARADARHLATTAVTDVMTETAGHLGEMQRQIARAETLTKAEQRIAKARAHAEERLREADKKHGELAGAFTARTLTLAVPPTGTPRAVTAPTPAITAANVTPAEQPATGNGTQASTPDTPTGGTADTPPAPPVTLTDLATVAGVPTPVPGEPLSNEQLDVVLRHLRYTDDPPRSYRQARDDFRNRGFVGSEERVRRVWGALLTHEETTPASE